MAFNIAALILQKNNTVFISNSGITYEKVASASSEQLVGVGLAGEVPTPDGGAVIDADYWAVPTDVGFISGFNYVPYNASDPVGSVKPNPQAFAVVRIMNTKASDYWYVVGTSAQYLTAAGGGAALPTTITTLLAGCQKMCQFDANGKYFAVFALPTLSGNKRYFPAGYWNGVALPSGTSIGYVSSTTLLTFLNTATTAVLTNGVVTSYTGGWGIAGTWTVSSDGLTLLATETAGPGTDLICAQVAAVNPSL